MSTSARRSPVSLVTGGAGFIGSHVTDELIRAGHRVIVLDDLSGGSLENVNPKASLRVGSVTDPAFVDSVFSGARIDYVYHFAAYAAEGLSHFVRRFNYTNNVVGSANLINASVRHGVRCFVYASSIAVYGAAPVPMREDVVLAPVDPYGVAKLAVELDLRAARRLFGLDYVIFRPHNVYGERQNVWDPFRNVIGIFMSQVARGLPCTIFGDGNQRRAFTHISDVAPVIAAAVDCPDAFGEVFNVGAGEPCSVNDLSAMVRRVMGRDTGVRYLPARAEVADAWCDHTKVRRVFGHEAKITLAEGLERMARWVKQAGPRSSRPAPPVEISRELPPSWAPLCTRAEESA
ncbi:MAG: NAD-dependent epimerase/dehydratase family protein [bacterium]|jgi:UDP-glucose 4-epimerase